MKSKRGSSIHFPVHYLRTADNVRLRYFDTGADLPAIIFANGLGGPVSAWKPYIARWQRQYRVLAWDYRGLYGSTLPSKGADLSVPAHARDLADVLTAAGVKRATLVGWSMGVQVGLEFYTHSPNVLTEFILVNGTYGRPLQGIPFPYSERTLRPMVKGLQKMHRLSRAVLRRLSDSRHSYSVLKTLKVVAPGLERDHFKEMIGEFRSVDLRRYFELLGQLGEHDAEHMLPSVKIPTLVVAGKKDILTPIWLSRKITRKIPDSELFVVPEGTHYSAAEYPELIAWRIEKFLKRPK